MRRMGAHNGGGGTKTRRMRYEVMRCVRGYRERHMAGGEWMMRWGRNHADQKRGGEQVSEDEERAKGREPHRTVRWRTDGKMT
jgi:hypothetical protein